MGHMKDRVVAEQETRYPPIKAGDLLLLIPVQGSALVRRGVVTAVNHDGTPHGIDWD